MIFAYIFAYLIGMSQTDEYRFPPSVSLSAFLK